MEKMSFMKKNDFLDLLADSVADLVIKSIKEGKEITKEFMDETPLVIRVNPNSSKVFTKITANHVKNGPIEVVKSSSYINNLVMNYKA